MKKVYLITGAAGHLGSALCMRLKERGEAMRALCMRGEDTTLVRQLGAEVFFGDVTQPETMRPFFTLPEGAQAVLLHCAGVVAGSGSLALMPMERRGLCQSQFSRSSRIAASCNTDARQVGDSSFS